MARKKKTPAVDTFQFTRDPDYYSGALPAAAYPVKKITRSGAKTIGSIFGAIFGKKKR